MKLVKTLFATAALVASSFATQASTINVGGVIWDPASPIDFQASFNFNQWFNGAELTGIGEFYQLNDEFFNVFIPGGELTFQFGGFVLDQMGNFSNGWLNVYTGFGADNNFGVNTTPTDVAKATDGNLWLSLTANFNTFIADNPQAQNPFLSGQLRVNWDVVPNVGVAWQNFNTDTGVQGTDLWSRASATFVGSVTRGGNGTIFGDSIPEPSSIAVLGLGLLGLAGVARRNKVK